MTARAEAGKSSSPAAKTAVLLIVCVFSVNSLAASNSLVECEEMSQDSQNLDVSTQTLSAKKTDHILVPAADTAIESPELAELDTQSIVPILSLTPRVMSILDQVFESEEAMAEEMEPEPSESESPVADYAINHDESNVKEELQLLQIEDQMFRKDI